MCKFVAKAETVLASNPAVVYYVCSASVAVLNPEICAGAVAYNTLLKQPMLKKLNTEAIARGCQVVVGVAKVGGTKGYEIAVVGVRKTRKIAGETMRDIENSLSNAARTIGFLNTPQGFYKLLQAMGGTLPAYPGK